MMTALTGLMISTICVLLLNWGWGRRKTENWAAGCVAGSAWIRSISIILGWASGSFAVFAVIAFVTLLIVGKMAKLSARPIAIISWSIFSVFWLWALAAYIQLFFEYEGWKQKVPFESMTERVHEPSSSDVDWAIPSDRNRDWSYDQISSRSYNVRNHSIQSIHTDTLAAFDRAAGFGPIRMRVIHPKAPYFSPDSTPPVPQPSVYDPNSTSLGDEIPRSSRPNLNELHTNSAEDFANAANWGYVKSRSEVAGFQSHRFSKLPDAQEGWKAERIDLISLLMHEKPVAYISESLPRMDDVGKLKTRELDEFETAGLAHIRKTDELFLRGNEQTLRVVGPLRSVNECQKCHGGKVGDLLGAFSYSLTKAKK